MPASKLPIDKDNFMTPHQAKADVAERLTRAGVPFTKLTAKTVSFEGFGYGAAVFVTIHGATYEAGGDGLKQCYFRDIPKPSEGGYVLNFSNCHWFVSQAV